MGLLARRTLVYTVLAPQGIDWGNGETATLIFVLAISKAITRRQWASMACS
nr:hypothetical protein [Aeromonas fluvialis]